jgi:hypothetical protein
MRQGMQFLRNALWQGARLLTRPFGDLCCALLFELSLAEPVPAVPDRLGVSFRLATEADLPTICQLYKDDPWLWLGSPQPYRDRLSRGERCYLATVNGEIAHINWTCFHWGDAVPGRPLRLRPGEVYTTDACTPHAFRGKGIHALVLGRMLNDARAEGARYAYTLGQLDRPAAHGGLLALGWRECGRVIYFERRGRPNAILLWLSGRTSALFR